MLNSEKEILEMFQNNKDGLTFEEIHKNEKFQPKAYFQNGKLTKISVALVGALNQMINKDVLVWKQGKYFLKSDIN